MEFCTKIPVINDLINHIPGNVYTRKFAYNDKQLQKRGKEK